MTTARSSSPLVSPSSAHARTAASPKEFTKSSWWDVLARVRQQVKEDNVGLLAAGVAFYVMLALVPALVASVSLYGLLADPAQVSEQVSSFSAALPAEIASLLTEQLESLTSSSGAGLGLGLLISLLAAVWGASKGMKAMMGAMNMAYDEDDERGFVKTNAVALALTVGAVLLMVSTALILGLLPYLASPLGRAGEVMVLVLRWPLLALVVAFALALVYRFAPARADAKWRWVTPGALFATVGWVVASALFTLYVNLFGKFNETYGSLGAVVVLLLWLHLSAFVVLVGAELNSEAERQTSVDTTTGGPRKMGSRDAYAADTVGPTAAEVKRSKKSGSE